jgi:propanediol utilization protein
MCTPWNYRLYQHKTSAEESYGVKSGDAISSVIYSFENSLILSLCMYGKIDDAPGIYISTPFASVSGELIAATRHIICNSRAKRYL